MLKIKICSCSSLHYELGIVQCFKLSVSTHLVAVLVHYLSSIYVMYVHGRFMFLCGTYHLLCIFVHMCIFITYKRMYGRVVNF